MLRNKKIQAIILATMLSTGILAGCAKKPNTNTNEGAKTTTDTSKEVNLVYYLWGGEGPANKDILAEINKKLKADINATLEIKYIDWPDVATKYPLLFASGEQFDMSHASPNAPISYYTLASQGALADITDTLNATPALKAAVPEDTWSGTKYNGKIYGVPSLYSEFTPTGYVYRRDLKEKYGVNAINSVDSMEAYMDAIVKNEKFAPLNGDANDAINLYRIMTDLTGNWIQAPGINNSEMYLVATSPDKYDDIIHPAFTQEFEDWAVKMHNWSQKGYWPKDILSSQQGAKVNFNNGKSGGFITHMADWTGNYGALKTSLPGVETDFWTPAEDKGKILKKAGVENSTVISTNSKNPERALMAIEKFMTDESYYRLIQNGIEGRQYEIANGVIKTPEKFNNDVDGGGFAVWSLRTDKFNIPFASEDPRRYELNDKWNKTAINNPFMGFSFDSKNVSSELSAITNVNSQLGIQLMLGKTQDPKKAVEQYRNNLKQAGVDKVIAEVKTQMTKFTPVK
jgi:putative aldouronate transport system substrate-binding protein